MMVQLSRPHWILFLGVLASSINLGHSFLQFATPSRAGISQTQLSARKETAVLSDDEESTEMMMPSVVDGEVENIQGLRTYQVPADDSNRHLAIVVLGTLWWYLYASWSIFQNPPVDFFGLDIDNIRLLGMYVTFSQLLVYGGLYKLARAETLREAQILVLGMTSLCVPADVATTLVNPTGSKGITILAFAEITLFFGTFLAHYLRKASYREVPPMATASQGYDGILDSLANYRPPMGIQATHMATDFTRSFVAFTIAAGSVGELLAGSEALDPIAVGSLLVVVLHTAAECTLTTVFPGANLSRYSSFLVAEIGLYSIHMFAASIATIQKVFGTGLIDQALFIWLFGSATAKVVFKVAALVGRVNLDEKLGLSNLDGTQE